MPLRRSLRADLVPLGRLAENAEVPKGTKSARSDLRKGIAV
jgi:hypothetical protein